jgi:hypothetical protein
MGKCIGNLPSASYLPVHTINYDQEKGFITFETFPKEFLLIGHICDILQKSANSPFFHPVFGPPFTP